MLKIRFQFGSEGLRTRIVEGQIDTLAQAFKQERLNPLFLSLLFPSGLDNDHPLWGGQTTLWQFSD